MRQVNIIVAKDELPQLLSYAGREQVIHLLTVEDEGLPPGVSPSEATSLLSRSATIRNRISALTTTLRHDEGEPEKINAPVDEIDNLALFLDQETSKLEGTLRELEESQGKLLTEKERTSELSRFLSGLEAIGMPLGAIGASGFLVNLIGECARESTASIQEDLDGLTYGNLIFVITHSLEKTQNFIAIFPRAFEEDARQAATALGARVEDAWKDLPSDTHEAKKLVDAGLQSIQQREQELEERRESMAKELGPRVKSLGVYAEILESRSQAVASSSATESTYLLNGWLPASEMQRFIEGSSKACRGLVSVHTQKEKVDHSNEHETPLENGLEEGEKNQPPTMVKSPTWTKPLQSLIDSFGIPSYYETNPLIFMILTFPIMYGLMFGDFGEGLIVLILGLYLWRIKRKGASLGDFFQPFVSGAELIVMLGIGTTVFGLIFGDFFGFESAKVFGFRPLFSPIEGQVTVGNVTVPRYMVFTLAFGFFHMLFGMGIGVYNRIRRGELGEAFFGPICWAWFYAASVYVIAQIALAGFKFSVALQNPIYLPLIFTPLLLSGWKEGGLHVMEVFIQSISNTFSYLRLWALNLSGYYIKFAIFVALGGPDITAVSLLGAALGNLLVMMLEGLIVFVQALRLHWVEWFGKFYQGGGLPFSPYREPVNWSM